MANSSLILLFESNKNELANSLKGFSLPKDIDAVQNTVSNYLDSLFDKDGEYRMSLTQSEDYILNAALSLLSAQYEMSSILKSKSAEENEVIVDNEVDDNEQANHASIKTSSNNPFLNKTVSASSALMGAGGGAILGQVVSSSWGPVFGAIAGTAISVYLSSRNEITSLKPQAPLQARQIPLSSHAEIVNSIDVDLFLDMTRKICESVDNLMATYRAQIRRVIDKYENQEKPSLEKDYLPILEGIQTLVGFERAHSEDERFSRKVSDRIEDLVEQVENFNFSVVDFSEENMSYFTVVPSPKAETSKQAFPAILKNGNVILRGKIFIPETVDKNTQE